jgi:hypothetical protein
VQGYLSYTLQSIIAQGSSLSDEVLDH